MKYGTPIMEMVMPKGISTGEKRFLDTASASNTIIEASITDTGK